LTGTISDERIAQKVKNRALLLATGFNHGQDVLDKPAAIIGLGTMRGAAPNYGVTQRAFGTVVGGLKTRDRDEAPQVGIGRQQETAAGGQDTRWRGLQRGAADPVLSKN
jgi:hypothetical protein